MHELALTHEIVAIVCRAAGDRRVHRVTLEIGELSAPRRSDRILFDVIARGTCAEGARLNICRTDGDDLMVTTMEIEAA